MILKNCHLIPGLSGGYGEPLADVMLKAGRIAQIAPHIEAQGEEVLDCAGKTLLPGFIDMHTHLVGLGSTSPTEVRVPMKLLADACDLVRHYLDYGFTTIRDCGTVLGTAIQVREMVNRGIVEGPRVLAAGQTVIPTETSMSYSLAVEDELADGADATRRIVRRQLAEQADFIKIYASGSAGYPKGKPLQPIMRADEVLMAVEVARDKGTYVAAHAHSDSAIRLCIDCGVHTIEHATYISDESISLIAGRDDCGIVPTLAAMYCNPGNDSPFWKERLGAMLEASSHTLSKAYRAGVKIGFGTDAIPGKGQYREGIEFKYRKEYMQCENIDILLQATKHSAELLGLGDEIGSVKEGYCADLVLVEGDPAGDISVVYGKPAYVLQGGKLVRDNTGPDVQP